jgi:hydroxymethylbilane synthase
MPEAAAQRGVLRVGTRGSQLARWQAEWVAERLRQLGQEVELVEISTRGDVDHARPIEEIGTRGVFTKEIQRALLAGEVDLAVHSLKDLPTEPVEGLVLAAVPPRESPADVLVLRAGSGELGAESGGQRAESRERRAETYSPLLDPGASLPRGARVGTGSLRRQAQLRHFRPDLQTADIRGNVDTRLRKLDEGQFDVIVLAEAGLRRLGLSNRIAHVLPFDLMLPAVGQGALAIECRADDAVTRNAVAPLANSESHVAVLAERALLAHLRGGCMAPVGALAEMDGNRLKLSAAVLSTDGTQRIFACEWTATIEPGSAEALGRCVAEALLDRGAADLIAAARS